MSESNAPAHEAAERPALIPATATLGALAALAMITYFVGLNLGISEICQAAKPVPVICLAVWVARSETTAMGWPVVVGLVFSVIGDVILERPDAPFVLGLLSFLVAHVAYIVGALIETRRAALLWLLPIVLWSAGVYAWLFSGMGDMALPVAVYVGVIAVMGWRMGARLDGSLASWLGIAGALLFMFSDSTIAVRKFAGEFYGAKTLIMVTYWAGQVGIAAGTLKAFR